MYDIKPTASQIIDSGLKNIINRQITIPEVEEIFSTDRIVDLRDKELLKARNQLITDDLDKYADNKII